MGSATNSFILPKILETLSAKPGSCDTVDNLCNEIEHYVLAENPREKITNVRKAVDKALQVGQSLGVITLTNEIIRMPFSLRANEETMTPNSDEEEDDVDDMDALDNTDNVPKSRRKTRSPKKHTPLTEEDLQYALMMSKNSRDNLMFPTDRVRRRRASRMRRQTRGRVTRRGRQRRVSRRRR